METRALCLFYWLFSSDTEELYKYEIYYSRMKLIHRLLSGEFFITFHNF